MLYNSNPKFLFQEVYEYNWTVCEQNHILEPQTVYVWTAIKNQDPLLFTMTPASQTHRR